MTTNNKYHQILDALQLLLQNRDLQSVSVSEIAHTAGIGKGSIYYYFSSKDEIFDALVQRSYEKPLSAAQALAQQEEISPFTRMAMIFQACRNSSSEFLKKETASAGSDQTRALLHQKYMQHLIAELKPALTEIIQQGIKKGDIHFDDPQSLAEIVLIVLTVKMDNTLSPSSSEDISRTMHSLVKLLEKGTENPAGSLNFLTAI